MGFDLVVGSCALVWFSTVFVWTVWLLVLECLLSVVMSFAGDSPVFLLWVWRLRVFV